MKIYFRQYLIGFLMRTYVTAYLDFLPDSVMFLKI